MWDILSDEELRKLVLGAPQVLGLDFETEVAPKIAALQARVGSLEAAKAEALRELRAQQRLWGN